MKRMIAVAMFLFTLASCNPSLIEVTPLPQPRDVTEEREKLNEIIDAVNDLWLRVNKLEKEMYDAYE